MVFNSKNEQNKPIKNTKERNVDTLIGTSAAITGDIISEGNVRVDGEFNGSIHSKKDVLIGEEGLVTGNITAKSIVIYGTVKGNVKSEDIIEVMSSGKLYGDMQAIRISISVGAVFKGKSQMEEVEEEPAYCEEAV